MTELQHLEERLKLAKERLNSAMAALAPKHKGGEWEEYDTANQEVLLFERKLAAAKNEEYAEPCGFQLRWDIGAPMPHLMVNDNRALLTFLLSEADPNWDGSYVTIVDQSDEHPLGLVEFDFCLSAKLGAPNDEVFEGHPLNGRGLEPYTAQRVVNSRWIKDLAEINSVHRGYRPESWREPELNHYVFWFHDSMFECVARSFNVEVHRLNFRQMLGKMVERLII